MWFVCLFLFLRTFCLWSGLSAEEEIGTELEQKDTKSKARAVLPWPTISGYCAVPHLAQGLTGLVCTFLGQPEGTLDPDRESGTSRIRNIHLLMLRLDFHFRLCSKKGGISLFGFRYTHSFTKYYCEILVQIRIRWLYMSYQDTESRLFEYESRLYQRVYI